MATEHRSGSSVEPVPSRRHRPSRAEQLAALGMRPDAPRTKRTVEEAAELTGRRLSTADDVTILRDGRRVRTRADVEAWIAELAATDEPT